MQAIGLLFLILNRLFWIAICVWTLILLFTRVYPITDGFGSLFVDLIGILLGFAILRLATARPGGARARPTNS